MLIVLLGIRSQTFSISIYPRWETEYELMVKDKKEA